MAAGIGKTFGAEVLLVRAHPPFRSKVSREGRTSQLEAFEDTLLREEKDLERRARELEDVLGRCPRTWVIEGNAVTAIMRETERDGRPTLVAVGRRGLGSVERLRLGSVSTKVVRVAPGPVLVCPHPRGQDRDGPRKEGHAWT